MSYLPPLFALVVLAATLKLWTVAREKSTWVRLASIVCLLSACIGCVVVFVPFLSSHLMCGEYVFPAVAAPDHSAVAQVTEFDCGAATPFRSYVRVRSTRTLVGRLGLTRWSTVFWVENDPRLVSMSWNGPNHLTIHYPVPYDDPKRWKCDSGWKGVKIECESYAPNYSAPIPRLPAPNRWVW